MVKKKKYIAIRAQGIILNRHSLTKKAQVFWLKIHFICSLNTLFQSILQSSNAFIVGRWIQVLEIAIYSSDYLGIRQKSSAAQPFFSIIDDNHRVSNLENTVNETGSQTCVLSRWKSIFFIAKKGVFLWFCISIVIKWHNTCHLLFLLF